MQITDPAGIKYDRHQLTTVVIVTTGTPSTGTITVRLMAHNSGRFLAVELDIAGLATATGWYAVLSGVQ